MKERIDTNPRILNFVLKRNKNFPNSHLPVLIYRKVVDLPSQKNKAAVIVQKIFAANGWKNSWRNGIYSFHHYHSITHECMAVSSGSAIVQLGGPEGKKIKLKQGDVLILPAGVAHKCLRFSENFLCVGAYPQGKDYDINIGTKSELAYAARHIKKCPVPAKDPVFGTKGFLRTYWK
jgi:uncharacterized protein YjlB